MDWAVPVLIFFKMMERDDLSLSRVEAERIIAILDDTTEKLGFLDRFINLTDFLRQSI